MKWHVPRFTFLVMALFVLTAAGCGDAETGSSALADINPTATVTDSGSLEGHATEGSELPGAPDSGSVELAPELSPADAWYNTEPLTMAELRGTPVLLVFWATY